MATTTQSEFHVKLEGLKLSTAAESRIERGIQALLLQELAAFTPNPDDPGTSPFPTHHTGGGTIVIPIKWPGYWLRVLNPEELKGVGKALNINEQEINIRQ
jgi:hypothetical protein